MSYAIIARNTGMWGCEALCKRNGEIETYRTREEAQAVADKRNAPRINNFAHYYVTEMED